MAALKVRAGRPDGAKPHGTMTSRVFGRLTLRTPSLCGSLMLVLAVAGCQQPDAAPPVATPALRLDRARVPQGGPLEMTYRFSVAGDAPEFNDHYGVFVHFFNANGELMFTDDHDPPVPTTDWELGQEIVYDRWMVLPLYPDYIGEVTVAVGLYSVAQGNRLPLAGDDMDQRSYRVATLEIAPPAESVVLTFEDGWNPIETIPEDPQREWRWTTDRATISFENPRVNRQLHLEMKGRPELFEPPQVLTLTIEDLVLATLEMASDEISHYVVPVSAASLGDAETVTVAFNVDQTFVPSVVTSGENPDGRELGIQVFYMFLDES